MNNIEDDNSRRTFVWLTLGIVVLGCVLFSAAAFFFFQPGAQSRVSKYFPSPTATFTNTSTPTSTITPTPTNTATPTPNKTAQAYDATAVYAADQWREIVSDTFETNQSDWYVDTDDDEYAKIIYQVKDGKYIWNATSHQGFVQRMRANPVSFDDFYFALEATQPGFTTAADYGIIFREDSSSNYYYFSINNKGQYTFWLYYKLEWTALIESTRSEIILPRKANKLAVLATGDHFIFFINDQYVTEIHNDTLDKGRVGMAAEISEPDLDIVFEFDNILLKVPK
jgi:hypothetical protein